ncbi:MAG TPA: DeoR/GlpR family DNA-binding transcription regulator [Acidimicrobiales bacterium]|nr:DeoR/GlpR family DNA-binding transcription regulator [Acidimicrobiales bacterium]
MSVSVDAIDRLARICDEIDARGRVRVSVLAADLAVSEMTIRRDLDVLAEQGRVRRVRGGALALGPQRFSERYAVQARAKERIAAKLVALVPESGAVGLDASSTLQRLAAAITGARQLTVATNGLEAFATLRDRPGVTVLLSGGQHDGRTDSLVGPLAARAAQDLSLERLFLSAAGLTADGTTEATLEEAAVKLALADVSGEVVLAVDHTKLGRAGVARCLPLNRIDLLVTDLEPKDERLRPYRGRVRVL